jgi:uncharacterized protein YeaO (DUF488 family)
MTQQVAYRRIYEEPAAGDGTRVLVDRVWPRGMRKDAARLDSWLRDIAPSTDLRRWYGHAPELFAEFRDRYRAELDDSAHEAAVAQLRELADGAGTDGLTLLTATKDLELSHAAVLAQWLGE